MDRVELLKIWVARDPFLSKGQAKLLAADLDYAVIALTVHPEILNPGGTVHGGALYTLADDVAGIAAAGDSRAYVTQSGALNGAE